MRLPISLCVVACAAIIAAWWWLGAAAPMPPAPLAAGEKLYCVSYTPFRGAQSPLEPSTRIEAWQIEDDLARLAPLTDCVRTYSTRNGLDQVAAIAARHGLKVMQGIWLGGDPAAAERDLARAVALALEFPDTIRSVVVGNEVLLRGEMAGPDLAAAIRRVKGQVRQPVTYADVWEFWLRHREVFEAVDFVTIHILPYWEDFPIPAAQAAAHVESIRRRVAEAFPAKEILIGETGWPSAGRMRQGALPSPVNQARVAHEVLSTAKRNGYHVNLIEAFDQPWKRRLEGTVGGHWGLLDGKRRTPKFGWGAPLSDHPQWRMQAAGGVALALLVFGAAVAARRGTVSAARWVGVAAMALASGSMIGWTAANVPLESLHAGDWLRALTLAVLAVIAPIAGAPVLVRGGQVPALAAILGAAKKGLPALEVVLGLALIALCVVATQVALGLVFDARYKDFPFAPLTGAAVPFVVLALARWSHTGARGTAELAFAAVLALSAVYIVPNETFANWQALWFGALLMALAASLLAARDAPG